MLKCIRIRSLQTGVRRAHNSAVAYEESSVKHQGLSPKFAYPFTFEEAGRPAGSGFGSKEKSFRPQETYAQIAKIKPGGMSDNTSDGKPPRLNPDATRSRLSPKFRVPFDEGPFWDPLAPTGIVSTNKWGRVSVSTDAGNAQK